MRTQDLIGLALNWAVEKALDRPEPIVINPPEMPKGVYRKTPTYLDRRRPSTYFNHGARIIFDNKISVVYFPFNKGPRWGARYPADTPSDARQFIMGPTALIAGCRCFVQHELGNEVEIPEELSDLRGGHLNTIEDYDE